jgi:hypothetical protein
METLRISISMGVNSMSKPARVSMPDKFIIQPNDLQNLEYYSAMGD